MVTLGPITNFSRYGMNLREVGVMHYGRERQKGGAPYLSFLGRKLRINSPTPRK